MVPDAVSRACIRSRHHRGVLAGSLEVRLTGGAAVGLLFAMSTGVTTPPEGVEPWGAAGPRPSRPRLPASSSTAPTAPTSIAPRRARQRPPGQPAGCPARPAPPDDDERVDDPYAVRGRPRGLAARPAAQRLAVRPAQRHRSAGPTLGPGVTLLSPLGGPGRRRTPRPARHARRAWRPRRPPSRRTTSATMPTPRLKVRSISSGATLPRSRDQPEDRRRRPGRAVDVARAGPSGSTRARLAASPPPVTWRERVDARRRGARAPGSPGRRSGSASSSSSPSVRAELVDVAVQRQSAPAVQQHVAGQRVAVGVQPARGHRDDDVAGPDPLAARAPRRRSTTPVAGAGHVVLVRARAARGARRSRRRSARSRPARSPRRCPRRSPAIRSGTTWPQAM